MLKRAETILQRELIRAVSLPARLRRSAVDLRRPRRVLVVRHDWIGDMILSTGVLRRIKEAHPQADVDVVASPANAVVLEGLPFVQRVFVHRQGDMRRLLRLRRELRVVGYDVALNGRVLRPKLTPDPALILLSSGAPRRVGVVGGGADFLYTDPVVVSPDAHFVRQMAALTAPLGLDPDAGDWRPSLHVGAAHREAAERMWSAVPGAGDRLLVNISARDADRWWPDDRYADVVLRLRAARPDLRALVVSTPAEFERARALAQRVEGVALEPSPLGRVFALVATATTALTPDTAIAHVASAFATPVVVLVQEIKKRFLPYRTPGRYVVAGATLDTLPAEPVAAALEFVLGARERLEDECLPMDPADIAPASTR